LCPFRSTIEYDAIQAISTDIKKKDLRNALKELVNRGLLFWDKKRNKYDFHPIVRNYCYNQCTSKMKKEIHYRIRDYFSSKSKPKESNINSVKDISNLIEYFYYTIMVKDYTLAHYIFNDGIKIYLDAFGEYHLMIELLESFLSEGEEPVPSLDSDTEKAQVLNDLAFAYKQVGHLINAIKIYQQHNIIREKNNDLSSLSAGLGNLSRVLFDTGDFNAAIYNIKKKNKIAQQIGDKDDIALGHLELGRYLAYIGRFKESDNYLKKGGRWFNKSRNRNGKFITMLYQNIRFFLTNDYIKVLKKIEETNITIQEIINIRYRIRYDILIANIELFKLKKQSYQNENIEKDVKLLHNRLSNILKDCVEHNLTKFKIETLLLFAKLYNISFSIQRDEENDISIKFYESIPKKYYVKIKTNYEKFSTAQRKALNYSVEALHLSILYKYIIKEIDILIFISGLFKIINNHASVKFFINEAQLRSQQKIDIETGVYTMKKKDTSYQYNIVYAETKILFENMEGNHDLYHARFNFMFSENI